MVRSVSIELLLDQREGERSVLVVFCGVHRRLSGLWRRPFIRNALYNTCRRHAWDSVGKREIILRIQHPKWCGRLRMCLYRTKGSPSQYYINDAVSTKSLKSVSCGKQGHCPICNLNSSLLHESVIDHRRIIFTR